MRFLSALCQPEANVQQAKQCDELVRVLITIGRLFIDIIFMFICLYYAIDPGPDST